MNHWGFTKSQREESNKTNTRILWLKELSHIPIILWGKRNNCVLCEDNLQVMQTERTVASGWVDKRGGAFPLFSVLASVCSSCLYRWVCASTEEYGRLPSDWFLSCSLSALGGCSLEINDVGSTKANKPLLSSAAVLSVFFPSPPSHFRPLHKAPVCPSVFRFLLFPLLQAFSELCPLCL